LLPPPLKYVNKQTKESMVSEAAAVGDWEHPSSTTSHQQCYHPQTALTSDLGKLQRDICLVGIKYFENTRPQN
jgi:hypothetical protein